MTRSHWGTFLSPGRLPSQMVNQSVGSFLWGSSPVVQWEAPTGHPIPGPAKSLGYWGNAISTCYNTANAFFFPFFTSKTFWWSLLLASVHDTSDLLPWSSFLPHSWAVPLYSPAHWDVQSLTQSLWSQSTAPPQLHWGQKPTRHLSWPDSGFEETNQQNIKFCLTKCATLGGRDLVGGRRVAWQINSPSRMVVLLTICPALFALECATFPYLEMTFFFCMTLPASFVWRSISDTLRVRANFSCLWRP